MNLNQRIEAFVLLGKKIREIVDNEAINQGVEVANSLLSNHSNEWYTPANIAYALKGISNNLDISTLKLWLAKYPKLEKKSTCKKIGLVTAGNIPLVGFHDVLCILISGHRLIIKHSSKDEKLMNWLLDELVSLAPDFKDYIQVETDQLKGFDAVIATGNDNTAKYFEYYFGKYPNIIRKNRNSIAILTGQETDDELKALADDMLLYFGLGCRNVSKIVVLENFDIQRIFKAVFDYQHLINHNKYANNFIYNKSIYLMNKVPFLENGFLILKEDSGMNSPISVVFYERYQDFEKIKEKIHSEQDKIQCIVAKNGVIEGAVGFGEAQKPNLWDYADNMDTLEFLLSLSC